MLRPEFTYCRKYNLLMSTLEITVFPILFPTSVLPLIFTQQRVIIGCVTALSANGKHLKLLLVLFQVFFFLMLLYPCLFCFIMFCFKRNPLEVYTRQRVSTMKNLTTFLASAVIFRSLLALSALIYFDSMVLFIHAVTYLISYAMTRDNHYRE